MGVKVREKDGKWYVFINHNGKRKSKCIGSKQAALKVQKILQAKLVLGDLELFNDTEPEQRFGVYAEAWLQGHPRHNCKPVSYCR